MKIHTQSRTYSIQNSRQQMLLPLFFDSVEFSNLCNTKLIIKQFGTTDADI